MNTHTSRPQFLHAQRLLHGVAWTIAIAGLAQAQAPIWRNLGSGPVAAAAPQVHEDARLAIGPTNSIYMAYNDGASGARLTVRQFNRTSNSWVSLAAPGSGSAGSAFFATMAFDGAGAPFATCYDYAQPSEWTLQSGSCGTTGSLSVRQYNRLAGSWDRLVAGPMSAGQSHCTGMAISNTDGAVYAVYKDGNEYQDPPTGSCQPGMSPNFGGVSVRKFQKVGTIWNMSYVGTPVFNNLLTPSVPGLRATWNESVAVDSVGRVYVGFTDAGFPSSVASDKPRPIVMRFDTGTGSWQSVGVPGGIMDVGGNQLNLVTDTQGVPYVAAFTWHGSFGCDHDIRVFKANLATNVTQSTWSQVGTSSPTGCDNATAMPTYDYRERVPLAFDENNVPYVAYRNGNNQNRITVRKLVNNTWVVVGTSGFSQPDAQYVTLAIGKHPNGSGTRTVPYVGYRENTGPLQVMAFF